ncbi:MAG: hypothetical protein ACTSX7_01220 [Alphaproteobacteria bacterium]
MISVTHILAGLLALAIATGANPAAAGGPGGIKVSGNINQTVVVGGGYSATRGANAKATTNIATIADGTRIHGDVNVTAIIESTTTIARGNNARALTEIGAISRQSNTGTSVTIVTGSVVNIADGGSGCVLIGSDRGSC